MKIQKPISPALSLLVAMLLFFTFQSCKKENNYSNDKTSGKNQNTSQKQNGTFSEEEEYDYSEEDIQRFINDVISNRTSPTEEVVNPNELLPIIQTTVNYCYSDIDTAFTEELDLDSLQFTPDYDGSGFILMSDIVGIMDDIADTIEYKISLSPSDPVRLITSWIKKSSDGTITAYFKYGKTHYYVPETFPSPPEVSGTGFQWNLQSNTSCNVSAQQQIREKGKTYMFDIRNYYITHMGYDIGTEGYLNGGFHVYKIYEETAFFAEDVLSVSTSGMPSVTINTYSPTASAIFEINRNAATLNGSVYELCLPKALVDFYIAHTQAVFDYLKPSASAYYLGFDVFSGQTIKSSMPHLNHAYVYDYTLFRIRESNHLMYK